MSAMADRARGLRERFLLKALVLKGRLGMNRRVFADIYRFNMWGDPESRSGSGSSLASTAALRRELPGILKQFGIRSMLDAGCGDCNWIRHSTLELDLYIGAEIVPELTMENRCRSWENGSYRREFLTLDIARDRIPPVDLILCRHCLIHLTHRDVLRCFENFRASGSKYLMATTIPTCRANRDVLAGSFRELNLELPPFSLPAPLAKLNDVVLIDGEYRTNGWLYLWRIGDLPGARSQAV